MDNILRTKFTAGLFDMSGMRAQANQIAKDLGFTKNGDIDSFRHAYTAAKLSYTQKLRGLGVGVTIPRMLGWAHEVFATRPSLDDRMVDLKNNEIGFQIAEEIDRKLDQMKVPEGVDRSEFKEALLRRTIAEAVHSGQLSQLSSRQKAQASSGDVFVHAYDRRTGHVQEYTRRVPRKD